MKVLFVNPSLRPEAPHRYLPVGLAYVVTSAKEAGYKFDLLDIDIARYSNEYVENFVAQNRYDVVALGSIVTHYKWVKWFINTLKSYQPTCKVIVGNSVGSSIPEVIFSYTGADIVILGEGDVALVEVLDALRDGKSLGEPVEPVKYVNHKNGDLPAAFAGNGIPGVVFRDEKNRIIHNGRRTSVKDINTLPYPDWDIFDVDAYIKSSVILAHETVRYPREKAIVFPVNTARGCVFKCTFCHYVFWHDPYRHRSAESVIGEIRRNQQKYGANYIEFWDELSFHKLRPTEKFLDALIEADLGIHWGCAVRSDLLGRSDETYEDRLRVARKFVESGALALSFSLESGNDDILQSMNKRIKSDYFGEQVRVMREAGLVSNTSIVLGYPQETPATIAETMEMCLRHRVYPSAGFLLPLPETGMWSYAIEHDFIKDPDHYLATLTERQDIVLNMTKMTDKELMDEVVKWLARLNEEFGGHLKPDSLIRTGGYTKHQEHQHQEVTHRHRNTTDSLNYARVAGVA